MSPPSVIVAASFHRSGSSLIQRVVGAALSGVMWGEFPHPVIASLREMLVSFEKKERLSFQQRRDYFELAGAEGWHANMMPAPEKLLDAQRDFLQALLASHGRPWGWKAVDHSTAELDHISRLFPRATQLLVVRDIRAVYLSLVSRGWDKWWPGGVDEIAREWSDRSLAYWQRAGADRTLFVRYEDIRHRLPDFITYIGGDMKAALSELDRVVSDTVGAKLDSKTREQIETIAGPALARLGYSLSAAS